MISETGSMEKEIANKETLRCLFCDYTCSKPAMLKRHNIKHSTVRRFNCNRCSHAAKTKYYLKVHMLTHEDSKPFACPKCEYSCKRQSYLKQHMLTHDAGEERQRHLISCVHKNCNYQTIHKSALLQHVNRTHSEEKPFHCSLCEYSSKHPQSLKSHMIRNHRNDKGREPLMKTCTFPNCNYKTVYSHTLLRHKRSHSDQRPFSCNACEMSFKQKRFLKQHERYCGGKKKTYLPCLIINCGYQTVSPRMLKKHLKLVHRKKYKNAFNSEDKSVEGSHWDSQLSPLVPEVALETPPPRTILSPSTSVESPVHLVVSGSVASPQKTSSAAKSPAATSMSPKAHSPAISGGTGMSPQMPFEEIPRDHCRICPSARQNNVISSNSGVLLPFYILSPISPVSVNAGSLRPFLVVPAVLPPSSSEISFTSSDVKAAPEEDSILPSSSRSPDREVTSESGGNGCSPTMAQSLGNDSSQMYTPAKHVKAANVDPCVSLNGSLTQEQISFSAKSAPGLLADTATEVAHLTEIMGNSIQTAEMNLNKLSGKMFKCLLCSSSFDKRMNAESHLWIEHIRKEWAEKCGRTKVDDIYLQFFQAQFTSPATSISKSIPPSTLHLQVQSQSAEEMINPLGDVDKLEEAYFNENDDEEKLFDPTSVSESSIFVEEATGTGKQITQVTPVDEKDIVNAALECKQETDEGDESLDYGSSANTHDFSEDSGYPEDSFGMTASGTDTRVNSISAASKVAVSTLSSTISAATSMSPNNNVTVPIAGVQDRSSRFIRPDGMDYFCTICKIRSTRSERLTDHIISFHFGEKTSAVQEQEGANEANEEILRCPGCKKVMIHPTEAFKARHMSHCSLAKRLCSRRPWRPAGKPVKINIKSATTLNQPDKNLAKLNQSEQSKPTVKNDSISSSVFKPEDVKRLIIPWCISGKYSFSKCKVCSILFTKYTNAEAHVRSVHLQLAVQTVPEENESPEESSNKNRSTSPSSPPPSPRNENSEEEENSAQATRTTSLGNKSERSKKRRRVCDEEDAASQEQETARKTPVTSHQLKHPEPSKSTAPTQSQVLSKFRPFSAFQAGDVLKKYIQPKRVSKPLDSLTSKEFKDAQKFIVKIDKSGYEGPGCGGKFPRPNAKSRHVRLKNSFESHYHCKICDERFFHLNEFETHKSDCTEHKDPALISPKKPKLLAQSWSASPTSAKVKSREHSILVDSPPDDEDGTIRKLEDAKSFVENLSKKRHRCKICKLTFGGGYSCCLKHVRKIHFGMKPFTCFKCHETFRYLKTYRNHGQICGTENTGITGVQKQSSSDKSSLKTNLSSKSTPVPEPPDDITYKCKLCNKVSSDKPLFRYHLVSVHYEELSKGKANSFVDMIEDIIDTLTEKTKPKKSSLTASQSKKRAKPSKRITQAKKGVRAAGSPNQTKPVPKSSGKPTQAQSVVDAKTDIDSSGAKFIYKETVNEWESSEPLTVHQDEKQLLVSLPELTHGCSIIKKTTVRLERLSFKGELPECLLSAAKALCGKLDAGTFQCKNCGRCFNTYGGVMGHV